MAESQRAASEASLQGKLRHGTMANPDEREQPHRPTNRWREERPPSPHVLKLALIAAAIILVIGILLYLKARHAPPALHGELQFKSAPLDATPHSKLSATSFTGQLFFV